MKSRISYFDKTVFRKNLTRFAPAWGLYTVFMLLCLFSLIDSGSRWYASNLTDFVQIAAIFTPCYALLCAQLLFGDLYNSRMCNALHALPLRRETWFGTNVLSGFAFHLIPTVIFAIPAVAYALLACYPGDWITALVWLLGVNLQFMCFFGIAVFSAFCVGSRFAQAVVYGILNFGALIVGWLVDTIFVPMYYGIQIDTEPFFWFSPMAQMLDESFYSYHFVDERYDESTQEYIRASIGPDENFFYYFIVAALGIGLIFLALQLYRKRKLEYAGDFIAIPALEPIFQVVYTVIMGTVFQFISDDLFGMESFFFLFLGLAVGWFTGRMLIERTPRVFRLKSFLRCGTVMAACALTLIIAAFDPFGIESWVPKTEEVESVTISDGHYSHHNAELILDDPADIEKIIAIQEKTLEEYRERLTHETTFEQAYTELIETEEYTREDLETMDFSMSITFTYKMKNGTTRNRYYNVWMGDEEGLYLKALFSSPEAVLGCDSDISRFLEENSHVLIRDTWAGDETFVYTSSALTGLYDAIIADCNAGTMGQSWSFHNADHSLYWLYFDGLDITVYSNCENTLQWLREQGFDVDELIEHKNEFG